MKKRDRGFTLLEMMVVVAIAALLLMVAVPSFTDMIRNSRMTSAANDFIAATHLARSEAIKRRTPVTVCTSADPLAATPSCTDSASLTGWLVFVDADGNGVVDGPADTDGDGVIDSAGDELLVQHAPIADTISTRSTLDPLAITYAGSGFSLAQVAAQLLMCDARGNRAAAGELSAARGITIAPTGRTFVTRNRDEIDDIRAAIGGAAVGGCT